MNSQKNKEMDWRSRLYQLNYDGFKTRPSGFAVTSLVAGLIAILLVMPPVISVRIAFSIIAVICGIIGIRRIQTNPKVEGSKIAIAGIIFGVIAVLIALFLEFIF